MKRILSCLMLIGILFALCSCGNGETAEMSRPSIAQPGSEKETELVLTERVSVEEADTVNAYRLHVDVEKAKEEVENAFGITLGPPTVDGMYVGPDYVVTIDQETGYWTYDSNESYSSLEPSEAPLSDAAAQEIAEQFVKDHGLWTGEVYNTVVTDITGGGWNEPEYSLGKDVYIYPGVEGKTILGVFRIVISMDHEGRLFSVYKLATDIDRAVPVQVKTRDMLEEDFASQNYSDSCSQQLQMPSIEEGSLQYYADAQAVNGMTYLYPVYVFTGEGTTADGQQERFDVIIDAQG